MEALMLAAHTGKRLLWRLANQIRAPVLLELWDGERIPLSENPAVVFRLTSPTALRYVLKPSMSSLGEAFVEGYIDIEGALREIIRAGEQMARSAGNQPWRSMLRRLHAHTRVSDSEAIRYHYDVSNDFYALWLDRNMVYSCAYYQTGGEDIHTAQEQKLEHICRKLRLKPGERLLDIGCGWGGLLCWAASKYGVRGVGITLSEQQRVYATEWIRAAGLARDVEIRLQDYREIAGEALFDKIVSVGMYEHVGIANLPRYFAVIGRLLRPAGLVLNHGITAGDRDGRAQGPPGGEFIDRFVFPGGEVPHISRVLYEIAGAGLEILDVEDLRPHYPQTLVRWLARLEAARAQAIAAAGAERYRIWRMYLAGMAHAFDRGWLSVCQTLALKPAEGRMAPRPWTRRYQYEPSAAVPISRGLDWGK